MFNLLGATVSESTYRIITGLRIAAFILIGLCAIAITIAILMQSTAEGNGTNALTGASETYYSQNKGSTREGVLKKITIISAIIIFVLTIFLTVLLVKFSK